MAPSLDLALGASIAAKVRVRFSTTVHPSDPSCDFVLVVSFARSSFPLSVDNVGHALRACIGCDPLASNVIHLRGSVYRFSVASKAIGFLIYNLRSFTCDLFRYHFHLWVSVALHGHVNMPYWNGNVMTHGSL